jgi:hypothetical protein
MLQTVGPALTARALDGRPGRPPPGGPDVVQEEILKALRGIQATLEAQQPAAVSPTASGAPSALGREDGPPVAGGGIHGADESERQT